MFSCRDYRQYLHLLSMCWHIIIYNTCMYGTYNIVINMFLFRRYHVHSMSVEVSVHVACSVISAMSHRTLQPLPVQTALPLPLPPRLGYSKLTLVTFPTISGASHLLDLIICVMSSVHLVWKTTVAQVTCTYMYVIRVLASVLY